MPSVFSRRIRSTNSTHPALIIPCCDDNRVVRVQAILLDPATGGKANVAAPKLTFGQARRMCRRASPRGMC